MEFFFRKVEGGGMPLHLKKDIYFNHKEMEHKSKIRKQALEMNMTRDGDLKQWVETPKDTI